MGIELDLRSNGSRLVLQHDPFREGEIFENLLRRYQHSFMVVNIKTEGIEEEALTLLAKRGIRDYFLLDLSFPALVRLVRKQEKNIAVRFSEYEPVEQCLLFKKSVRWVWIDCFNSLPLDDPSYHALKRYFKLCIVSPEIQSHPKEGISVFKNRLSNYEIDAICTKYPKLWENRNSFRKLRIRG